jgi:hypothetical protein
MIPRAAREGIWDVTCSIPTDCMRRFLHSLSSLWHIRYFCFFAVQLQMLHTTFTHDVAALELLSLSGRILLDLIFSAG